MKKTFNIGKFESKNNEKFTDFFNRYLKEQKGIVGHDVICHVFVETVDLTIVCNLVINTRCATYDAIGSRLLQKGNTIYDIDNLIDEVIR